MFSLRHLSQMNLPILLLLAVSVAALPRQKREDNASTAADVTATLDSDSITTLATTPATMLENDSSITPEAIPSPLPTTLGNTPSKTSAIATGSLSQLPPSPLRRRKRWVNLPYLLNGIMRNWRPIGPGQGPMGPGGVPMGQGGGPMGPWARPMGPGVGPMGPWARPMVPGVGPMGPGGGPMGPGVGPMGPWARPMGPGGPMGPWGGPMGMRGPMWNYPRF
uniref:Uncharacterized protein n=1 Tax=Haemonchus contortus TaxID=6289 RepID=W6NHF3_HAECO